jgi:cation:H+ antiporter
MEALFARLPIWVDFLVFAVGVLLIDRGAKVLVDSSVSISKKTGIPKMVIGATIMSVATTFPEFTVSVVATIMGYNQMAVGNVVGSCVCNIGLVSGLCILVLPVAVDRRDALEKSLVMLAAGILLTMFAFHGLLPRWAGIMLLACFGVYVARTLSKTMREADPADATAAEGGRLTGDLLRFLAGMACVGIASTLLVQTGKQIAVWFGVPDLIIGLTMIALGTSLPELVTALRSAFMGQSELSVGNVIGSNILNILWALGACSLIRPLKLVRQNLVLDCPFMLALMAGMALSVALSKRLGRAHGIAFVVIYAAYITLMMLFFIGPAPLTSAPIVSS